MNITLERVEEWRQKFPDGTISGPGIQLIFKIEGIDSPFIKAVSVSKCFKVTHSSEKAMKIEKMHQCAKAIREVQRDALYAIHGNKFKQYEDDALWGPGNIDAMLCQIESSGLAW